MAAEIRFEGRVAFVTGAGRALGRADAMLLAERGAKVVVDDFGGGPDGAGGDTSVAEAVVAEIVARGGEPSRTSLLQSSNRGGQFNENKHNRD